MSIIVPMPTNIASQESPATPIILDKPRRKQGGLVCKDAILSAHVGNNAPVFRQILDLHVPKGATVADLTYGRGVFWKDIAVADYQVLASDLKVGQCWRTLPYGDLSVDAVVFDPPYMEGLYRKTPEALAGAGTHRPFQEAYSNGSTQSSGAVRKYHDAVLEAYLSVTDAVKRILRPSGKFIVKCQDEVSANRQKLTHVELVWAYEARGFYCKDLFVVVRTNTPAISRLVKQEHARKNHSYFLVFERQDHRRMTYSNFAPWLRGDI